jgi:nuclear transport factor 2 (NTF2) superfamily protein
MNNKEIEEIAIAAVVAYENENGRLASRVSGRGYDLISRNNVEERHIEVKGTAKEKLTQRWLEEREYKTMKEDPHFYLYAVTKVDSHPRVYEFTKQQVIERFKREEIKYMFEFGKNDFKE